MVYFLDLERHNAILVYSKVMEALLYKEQDLLRFVNNLAVISKLLLYVRACGMPYKRDETPKKR